MWGTWAFYNTKKLIDLKYMLIDIQKIFTKNFKENFKIKEKYICGILCYLIFPNKGFNAWTKELLIFRSSIWDCDGNLVSPSFPKFFNISERLDIYPLTQAEQKYSLIEKLDGSTLIVSKYKKEIILRTRGTFSASHDDIIAFKNSPLYANVVKSLEANQGITYIFEWVSPNNKVILQYDNVDFYLIGGINHENYSLLTQKQLDRIAETELKCKRPNKYIFNSLEHLKEEIEQWENKEGICIYYNKDQNIRKIKSVYYLRLHAFRAKCNLNYLLDIVVKLNFPSMEETLNYIEKEYDYETLIYSKPMVTELYLAIKQCDQEIEDLEYMINKLSHLEQKDFAIFLQTSSLSNDPIKNNILTGLAFSIRNNKSLTKLKIELIRCFLN